MKRFKKDEKVKQKEKGDISSMYYWGEETKLLAASWDGKIRLYDDNDATDEGTLKFKVEKHKDSVN